HQHADAVARLDAELVQAIGDAVGALGDLRVVAPALAADDAVEGGCWHCRFPSSRRVLEKLSFRGVRSTNPESRDSGSGPSDHPGMTARLIPHPQILVRVFPDWRARLPAGWVRPSASSARWIRRAAPGRDRRTNC